MSDFEGKRLDIYEKYIDGISEKVDTSHGDVVFPDFRERVDSSDGYNEADIVIEITIANEIEKKLVLMVSNIVEEERRIVEDVNDEEALKRARSYAAKIENGAYFGLTNGKEIKVVPIDPDIRLVEKDSIDNLPVIIERIIKEERRIKDSREFINKLRSYHEELEPYIKSVLADKLKNQEEFEKRMRRFLVPIGQSYEEDEEIPQETLDMLSMQATYLLIDKILFYYLILENEDNLKESLSDEKYNEIFDKLKKEPPAPDTINEEWAEEFWKHLEGLFNLIQKINYAPVFDPRPSPLNEITLETQPSACYELKELMDFLYGKEKLSNLFNGPLLAKIYEELIPPDLRWKWGQIYTPPEVTRLITKWAIQKPEDKVLDPACGTGRFLVSAYERLADLKGVELGEKHQEIMDQIHGIDINQFPAHLATMSIVSMNLGSFTEEVDLRVRDFFRFQAGQTNFFPEESKVELTGQTSIGKKGLGGQGKLSFGTAVGKMDAIVMNPPYTRQEAIGDEYKGFVREEALSKVKDREKVKMAKRAGFYVYFMIHGAKFLKENGRFGMIVQNSWLDVDYGKDVQEFLLDNYRIKAIIGPQRHRFIKTASVNTVIVLLEKESKKQKRDENRVKFVQLKKSVEWFEQNYGFDTVLNIIEENDKYMDSDLRVISKTQKELKEKGEGKWNKYIRAPDIYFKILDKAGDKLIPLREVAEVTRGFTTGANDFFYLPKPGEANKFFYGEMDEENGDLLLFLKDKNVRKSFEDQGFNIDDPIFRIEKEYWMHEKSGDKEDLKEEFEFVFEDSKGKTWVPNYIVKSPREIEKPIVEPRKLKNVVLMVHEPKNELSKGVRDYIEWGEKWDPERGSKYPERPTCANRSNWFELTPIYGNILCMMTINDRYTFWANPHKVFFDARLYGISLEGESDSRTIGGILNSTLSYMFNELQGRVNLGEGALDVKVYEYEKIPLLKPSSGTGRDISNIKSSLNKLSEPIHSIFKEIRVETPEEISLDKVKKDRRELDKVIMEDILGLSKKEQLEVYRGVVQLVKDRIETAQSEKQVE